MTISEGVEVEQSEIQNLALTTQAHIQVITLAVPRSTPWQPQVAHQLMVNLFALRAPVYLGIKATAASMGWYIEAQTEQAETVVKTVYALYPQAQVTVGSKTGNHLGYYLFDLHTATPFIAPLKMAEDFNHLDPLAPLISSLSNLDTEETVVYELGLREPKDEYYKLGEKLITASTVDWWHFLHPQGAVLAATRKLSGADQVDKYVPEIQKPARAKLNSPLIEVRFGIKIKTASRERASELIRQLFPALAVFEREGFNFLVAPHEKSFGPVLTAGEVAALWHLPGEQMQTPGIVWARSAAAPIPQELTGQTEGIILGTNTFQGRSHRVRLAYDDRVTHVNLVGRTRVGKSTLLHHMIYQDIAAGKGVALIDPHGDLVDAVLATSISPGREGDVVLFDTRDQDYPIGLNLLTVQPGVSQEVTASYALTVVRKMFAEQWSGGRMEMVLDAALRTLVAMPGSTIQDVPKLLLDARFRRQVLKQVDDPATLDFWYDEYDQESPAQQREFTRPISHRIRKFYRDPTVRHIVCQKDSLNFRHILDQGKIFLANLGGLAEIEAETLGVLLISKLQLAAMSRSTVPPQQRTPFYVYVDEVQNFITTSLSKVFSEAGKYGLSLVVANQYLKQLEGETLAALMGNVGTTVIFGVGPEDARALAPFVKPEFTVEDLVRLDRFAAVVKMQLAGQSLPAFSLQAAPPLGRPDDAEERFARMRQYSRRQYARPKEEVDAELMSRYEHSELNEPGETREDYFD